MSGNTNCNGGGRMAAIAPQLCFILLLFISSVSYGGGGGSYVSSANKLESNQTLVGFPHQIDIYTPAVANKVVVFLHGGGGLKYEFALNLGLNMINSPPTMTSINWSWLNTNKVIAIFPQGQALPGYPSATTWSNHVMVSGVDDVAFLKALASYIKKKYGISAIYLAGHSNGGMMANRVWCEAPDTFKAYISLSGPASSYYLAPTTPCAPSTVKPYYGIVGGMDGVLQDAGKWDQPTWVISPLLTTSPAFVNPGLVGEWSRYISRSSHMCNELPVLANNVSDGVVDTWNNCNGRLRLQEVLLGSHSISSLETQSGQKMRDLIISYINQLP